MEEPARKARTLRAEGLVNARDLGGLERIDGTLTPRGVFFRSDNVDRISPDGWQQVHEAFRTALAGFDLPGFIEAAGLSASDRDALFSWRGSVVETAGAGSL